MKIGGSVTMREKQRMDTGVQFLLYPPNFFYINKLHKFTEKFLIRKKSFYPSTSLGVVTFYGSTLYCLRNEASSQNKVIWIILRDCFNQARVGERISLLHSRSTYFSKNWFFDSFVSSFLPSFIKLI